MIPEPVLICSYTLTVQDHKRVVLDGDEPAEPAEPAETAETNEPAETAETNEPAEQDEPAEQAEQDEPEIHYKLLEQY